MQLNVVRFFSMSGIAHQTMEYGAEKIFLIFYFFFYFWAFFTTVWTSQCNYVEYNGWSWSRTVIQSVVFLLLGEPD